MKYKSKLTKYVSGKTLHSSFLPNWPPLQTAGRFFSVREKPTGRGKCDGSKQRRNIAIIVCYFTLQENPPTFMILANSAPASGQWNIQHCFSILQPRTYIQENITNRKISFGCQGWSGYRWKMKQTVNWMLFCHFFNYNIEEYTTQWIYYFLRSVVPVYICRS